LAPHQSRLQKKGLVTLDECDATLAEEDDAEQDEEGVAMHHALPDEDGDAAARDRWSAAPPCRMAADTGTRGGARGYYTWAR